MVGGGGVGIAEWWNGLWSGIGNFFKDTWDGFINWGKDLLIGYVQWAYGVGSGIVDWWNGLWGGIGDFFASIWEGFGNIVRDAWNGIIGWIEGGVNGAISLINGIISGINIIGGVIGIHLDLIPSVRLPRLATGGIITAPTIAEVGEAGREAVIPLDSPMGRDILGGGRSDEPIKIDRESLNVLARLLAQATRQQFRQKEV